MVEKNYRQIWEEANGPIPKGMHIHHILPRYMGGTDELDNLQMVTPEEHYDIHLERGEYGACALLSDGIDREAPTKPVVQFSLTGHKLRVWPSYSEATRHFNNLGYPGGGISACCDYKQKSLWGYQWFYESEVGDIDYIGPVKYKAEYNVRGHDTSQYHMFDLLDIKVYKSKSDCGRIIEGKDPYDRSYKPFGTTFKSKIFTDRFIPITKEEYYYLQKLIKL